MSQTAKRRIYETLSIEYNKSHLVPANVYRTKQCNLRAYFKYLYTHSIL